MYLSEHPAIINIAPTLICWRRQGLNIHQESGKQHCLAILALCTCCRVAPCGIISGYSLCMPSDIVSEICPGMHCVLQISRKHGHQLQFCYELSNDVTLHHAVLCQYVQNLPSISTWISEMFSSSQNKRKNAGDGFVRCRRVRDDQRGQLCRAGDRDGGPDCHGLLPPSTCLFRVF